MPPRVISIDTRELVEEVRGLIGDEDHPDPDLLADLDDDEKERADEIRQVLSDIGAEAFHGAQLIREDTFEEFAREFAEEIGAMPHADQWPAYCIDWERAANELRMDYTSVEFDGSTWYVRA